MLRAYYNMPADEFIAQLRVYVVAMGLSPQVIDAIDNLKGCDDEENEHAAELEAAEDEAAKSMKEGILETIDIWLEDQPDGVAELCKTLIEEIKNT